MAKSKRDKRLESIKITGGVQAIAFERSRQITSEGWSEAHDDQHQPGQIARAAICYAAPKPVYELDLSDTRATARFSDPWPWAQEWDKRKRFNYRRRLIIAGALIAAEIDRIDRAAARKRKGGQQ